MTAWLGHRRSWMLAAQIAVIIGLWLISGQDPSAHLGLMALFAVFVGFSGATQDIVIDAWRIEVADDRQQGIMAAAYQWGYRLAMIVAGAVPLVLAQAYSWNLSYAVMAGLMGVGVLAVLLRAARAEPMPSGRSTPRRSSRARHCELRWNGWCAALFCVLGALIAGAGLTGDPTPLSLLARLVGSDGRLRSGGALARIVRQRRSCRSARWWSASSSLRLGCAPLPGRRTRSGRLSRRLVRRAAGRLLPPLCRHRRPDPGADLPLPGVGLRAEHHEPVLPRPRLHQDRDRRGAEGVRRGGVDGSGCSSAAIRS